MMHQNMFYIWYQIYSVSDCKKSTSMVWYQNKFYICKFPRKQIAADGETNICPSDETLKFERFRKTTTGKKILKTSDQTSDGMDQHTKFQPMGLSI